MKQLDQKVPIRKPPKGLLYVHGSFSVWRVITRPIRTRFCLMAPFRGLPHTTSSTGGAASLTQCSNSSLVGFLDIIIIFSCWVSGPKIGNSLSGATYHRWKFPSAYDFFFFQQRYATITPPTEKSITPEGSGATAISFSGCSLSCRP